MTGAKKKFLSESPVTRKSKFLPSAVAGCLCAAIMLLAASPPAQAKDSDLQFWNPVFVNHDFANSWSASMQVEQRWSNDDSALDELVFKPGGYYRFTDKLQLGFGYKYISKNAEGDEQDLWQEIYYKTPLGKWSITHQVRLEQRFINDISGVLPRLRYLIGVQYPLNETYYLSGSEAVRFNLGNKGEGPASGFEQNRIYFGLGAHATDSLAVEFGYLWRYEKEREGPNKSDNVIRLQFLINTKGRPHPMHGGT